MHSPQRYASCARERQQLRSVEIDERRHRATLVVCARDARDGRAFKLCFVVYVSIGAAILLSLRRAPVGRLHHWVHRKKNLMEVVDSLVPTAGAGVPVGVVGDSVVPSNGLS